MRRVVYKFTLEITDEQTISLPRGADLLHVGDQREDDRSLELWALIDLDPNAERVERRFRIAGTGHPLLAEATARKHVGTVITAGGHLVWHVFDLGEVA